MSNAIPPWPIGFMRTATLLGMLLTVGCKSAYVAQPLTAELAGNSAKDQMAFWHALAERPVTSNDEAFHGLLLYLDGKDLSADYAARVDTLKARKMLPAGFDRAANQAATRGTIAVAMCRILAIKGGVMMRLTSAHPRYAVRELMFMDLYPPSAPWQTFSGNEYVAIIGRIEDHQRNPKPTTAPTTLPAD